MHLRTICSSLLLLAAGCTGIPKGITPIANFEAGRYLGGWYEIARLDHSFERGMDEAKAVYSLRDDGGIEVVNSGVRDGVRREVVGRAYFADVPTKGYLKVSFFRPFYGSYVIFDLANDYSTALVCGPNRDYFWILSRTPEISAQKRAELLKKASDAGFDTRSLIYPKQTLAP